MNFKRIANAWCVFSVVGIFVWSALILCALSVKGIIIWDGVVPVFPHWGCFNSNPLLLPTGITVGYARLLYDVFGVGPGFSWIFLKFMGIWLFLGATSLFPLGLYYMLAPDRRKNRLMTALCFVGTWLILWRVL
jgi:hypothetical protein